MFNLIVAPSSVNSHAEKFAKQAVKYLKSQKIEYSVYFSKTLEDIQTNTTELLAFGETEFIIVGNDLAVHTFLNAAKDLSKIKIGIMPVDDNDDFAQYLGLETNPTQAVKNITAKNVESVDILLVNDVRVLNSINIGASVEVFEQFSQYKLKNMFTEKFATLTHGNKFAGIELNLDVKNSKGKKENIFELVVANGGLSQGKQVSPLSNVKDGLFNLNYSTITSNGKKQYLKKISKGEHVYDSNTKQYWLNNLKITNADKRIKALVDGKILEFESLDIKIIEKGLKIYR